MNRGQPVARKREGIADVVRASHADVSRPRCAVRSEVGNLQMLDRLGLHTRLGSSMSGDADEEEADRIAERVVSGEPTETIQPRSIGRSECATCQRERVQAKEKPGRAMQINSKLASQITSLRGGGSPLPLSVRADYEPRLGRDLGRVRVHTDASAAESAQAIHARAYTAGQDVAFNEGEYQPEIREGKKLLAHELTHVVQQMSDGGPVTRIQRSPDPEMAAEASAEGPTCDPADEGGVCEPELPAGPAPAPAKELKLDADPCELVVTTLSNEALIAQIKRTRQYLDARERGDDDYYAFANLMRRLAVERQERMKRGHVWIGDDIQAPWTLYQLTSGEFGEVVIELADAEAERKDVSTVYENSQLSIVTPWQLRRFLDSQNIPDVGADEYFARYQGIATPGPIRILPPLLPLPASREGLGSSRIPYDPDRLWEDLLPAGVGAGISGGSTYQDPFSIYSRSQISNPVFSANVDMSNPRSVTGARSAWRGALPEINLTSQNYGLFQTDLNKIQDNFPIFDLLSHLRSQYISVKSAVPTNPTDAPNFGTYMEGFDDIMNVARPATMNRAMTALNTNLGTSITVPELVDQAFLAVNVDHVDAVRDRIQARVQANPGDYILLFDSLLLDRPIEINGMRYRTWAQVQAAQVSGAMAQLDVDDVVDRLARQARTRVIDNGFTTAEMRNLLTFRESFQNLPQGQFERLAMPELIEAQRYGGGWAGTRMAMRQAALRGSGQGAVLTAGLDLIRYLNDPSAHPDLGRMLAVDVPAGTLGAAGAGAIESGLNARFSQAMLTEAMAGGVVPRNLPIWGRGASGGVAGGVTAPVTTMAAMGIDELFFGADYTYIDYLAKGARAVPSGAVAGAGGALAAGAVGAASGSEVPLLGNAVGFVVGVGLYFLSDWIWGDSIEEEVRLALGEGGCPRPEPAEMDDYPPDYMMF